MGYLVTISYLKMVDGWDSEQGASGHPRDVDERKTSKSFNHKPTKIDIARMVMNEFFLSFDDARHDPEVDGRFTISQIEDNDGNKDSEGKWLADYDLAISIEKTSHVKVGSLSTPSF